jgi:hypothetical protein
MISKENKELVYSKASIILQVTAVFYWLLFQTNTDSYYSVYLICGILGLVSLYDNFARKRFPDTKREMAVFLVCAVLFSMMLIAANYDHEYRILDQRSRISVLFDKIRIIIDFFMLLVGGISMAWNTFIFLYDNFERRSAIITRKENRRVNRIAVFSFLSFCFINMMNLFLCNYPCIMSPDSRGQITQIMTHTYNNHHPFWHTMLIKLWLDAGQGLFHSYNAGIAMYCIAQILVLAAGFSMAVTTMYELGLPKHIVVVCIVWYLAMPFNLAYSITVWKDTFFSGAFLLFVTGSYRIIKKIGKWTWINWLFTIIGGLGICLIRNNGWFVFLVTGIVALLMYFKTQRRLLVCMGCIILVTAIMNHPVLNALHVEPTEPAEAYNIPIQQIARVIVSGDSLTDEQRALIEKLVDINSIPYNSALADPVRLQIQYSPNVDYLVNHKSDYFRMWIALGIKYPKDYFEAWVDQTRGYWNGGYEYWRWLDGVEENDAGIQSAVAVPILHDAYELYLWIFEKSMMLQLFLCIGLHFWIIMTMTVFSFVKKNRDEFFIAVPVIVLIFTLLIATPVFCEFRYSYAMFLCCPMIVTATLYALKSKPGNGKEYNK